MSVYILQPGKSWSYYEHEGTSVARVELKGGLKYVKICQNNQLFKTFPRDEIL